MIRKTRSPPHLDQLHRAAEFDDADGDPTLHSANQCILKKAGQPEGRVRPALRVLQFLPDTSNSAMQAGITEHVWTIDELLE